MKPNEVMIGDWVFNEVPCYVTAIYPNGTMDCQGDDWAISTDRVDPIPLTKEILEKNFEVTDDVVYGKHYGYYTDYMEVDIYEYTEGIWQIRLDEIEMSGLPTWKMYVSNVHELQHALRLCGIEKEIEI